MISLPSSRGVIKGGGGKLIKLSWSARLNHFSSASVWFGTGQTTQFGLVLHSLMNTLTKNYASANSSLTRPNQICCQPMIKSDFYWKFRLNLIWSREAQLGLHWTQDRASSVCWDWNKFWHVHLAHSMPILTFSLCWWYF